MRPIIQVRNLSKRYRIGSRQPYHTLRESLMHTAAAPARLVRRSLTALDRRAAPKPPGEYVEALANVSFEVQPGEVLGVIGRNGAGKSTLLKILARITEPTTGQAELYGRVGSLLEVGTGFHPELSGRDNVYLSGAILGMRRAEIARKFDEIVAFAEVDRFIDTPVKHYSSGMYVRLAFGVAAHLEPEILLVDEVLAVGDAAFQKRCLGKMGDVARSGRTVIFVSHNMASIESLCRSCMLLGNGKLEAHGVPAEVIARYVATDLAIESGECSLLAHPGRMRGSVATMTSAMLYSQGQKPSGAIRIGDPLSIRVSYTAARPLLPFLGIAVRTIQGAPVFAVSERFSHQLKDCAPALNGTVVCNLERVALMPGTYVLDLYLGDAGNDFDRITDAIRFEVLASDALGTGRLPPSSFGPLFCAPTWSLVAE